jgi:hypothetical protein
MVGLLGQFLFKFLAIYYTHMKYRESKIEAVRKKEFGTEQINHIRKLNSLGTKGKEEKENTCLEQRKKLFYGHMKKYSIGWE